MIFQHLLHHRPDVLGRFGEHAPRCFLAAHIAKLHLMPRDVAMLERTQRVGVKGLGGVKHIIVQLAAHIHKSALHEGLALITATGGISLGKSLHRAADHLVRKVVSLQLFHGLSQYLRFFGACIFLGPLVQSLPRLLLGDTERNDHFREIVGVFEFPPHQLRPAEAAHLRHIPFRK